MHSSRSTEGEPDVAEPRSVLLSIRPKYARAIIEGRKRVEVRRQSVRAEPGARLVLYATSPHQAIVATASLGSTVRCTAQEAWRLHSEVLALDREELDAYLQGGMGSFLTLVDVHELSRPLSLGDLRRDRSFRPPRSYRFVSSSDPYAIQDLVSSRSRLTEPVRTGSSG